MLNGLLPSMALAIIAVLASFTTANPDVPILRNNQIQFLRIEQAPYPAAGYRPQGEQFRLPFKSSQQQTVYGPPEPEVPETSTPIEEITTTTELPDVTTTEPEKLKDNVEEVREQLAENYDEEGVYYIYHPDGLLQKVVYATRSEDMGYTARLTYKDVEPIKEPIYTYDAKTLVFSKLQL